MEEFIILDCDLARLRTASYVKISTSKTFAFTSPLNFHMCNLTYQQVTVGSSSRAESISQSLDSPSTAFKLISERGFLTITGRYKNVPISIVSIGMGYPNMDFFVREARECLTGDMVIIRYKHNHSFVVNS